MVDKGFVAAADKHLAVAADKRSVEAERLVAAKPETKECQRGQLVVVRAANFRRFRRTQNSADSSRHSVGI